MTWQRRRQTVYLWHSWPSEYTHIKDRTCRTNCKHPAKLHSQTHTHTHTTSTGTQGRLPVTLLAKRFHLHSSFTHVTQTRGQDTCLSKDHTNGKETCFTDSYHTDTHDRNHRTRPVPHLTTRLHLNTYTHTHKAWHAPEDKTPAQTPGDEISLTFITITHTQLDMNQRTRPFTRFTPGHKTSHIHHTHTLSHTHNLTLFRGQDTCLTPGHMILHPLSTTCLNWHPHGQPTY